MIQLADVSDNESIVLEEANIDYMTGSVLHKQHQHYRQDDVFVKPEEVDHHVQEWIQPDYVG